MIFKFDLITGPGQNHMMPQAGVHTAIQNTQPGTHPQFIPQGRSVIMSKFKVHQVRNTTELNQI
jgi:hypothetical protein